MRMLVVYCHPDPHSYAAALRHAAVEALLAAGHHVREIDLYAEGFDPVLRAAEKHSYVDETRKNIAAVSLHVEALRWCEGWVVIYPTWYYGVPAMLKGWLDRVWLPGVAFQLPERSGRVIRGELAHVRAFVGITTSGSPWWWLKCVGDPGRSLFMKALRPLYAPRCRMRWLQLHDMDHTSKSARQAFLARVRSEMSRV